MALPNNNKSKKKIFDLMFDNCVLENDDFTYFDIKPYYKDDNWYVDVRYGLKEETYKVIEEKDYIKFELVDFKIYD